MNLIRSVICAILLLSNQQSWSQGINVGTVQVEKVLPSQQHLDWADAEIGVLIHFDLVNFVPDYEWRDWGSHPPASVFTPTRLDTDQWLQTAQELGAEYAILVAKHCSGFSLWPTEAHGYSVKNSPWREGKGDIVADFIASCKKYGIKPGLYYSTSANGYFSVDNPGLVVSKDSVKQKEYIGVVMQQLKELWGNYGELFEIWFDGGVLPVSEGGPDAAKLLKELQPNAVVFQGPAEANNLIRWVGNEEGRAPYPNWSRTNHGTAADGTIEIEDLKGSYDGQIWCPGEADFPLRKGWQGGWFWKAEGQELLSLAELMESYYTSVGRNSNMLLGVVVDTNGLVPDEDVERIRAFGKEIKRRFDTPIMATRGEGPTLEMKIGNHPTPVNHVIIEEDISRGENIRKYYVEASVNGRWEPLCEGISVGHKRIQQFEEVCTDKIRLQILESDELPQIKKLSVYHVE